MQETQEDKLITSSNRNNQNIQDPLKSNQESNRQSHFAENNDSPIYNRNNFRETALELNPNENRQIDEVVSPIEEINIDIEQNHNTTNDNKEEEMNKCKSIFKSCIEILINGLLVCFIFFIYYQMEITDEIMIALVLIFQLLSLVFTLLKKSRENKRIFIIERMNIFFVSVSFLKKFSV